MYDFELKEIILEKNNQKIYGVAYIPSKKTKSPLVILSHGLGGNYEDGKGYAEIFASNGIAAYSFDFRGGGGIHSDGQMTDMSVMTEVEDLKTVLEYAQNWEFIDPEKIVLLGSSQGGIVSAIVAADEVEKIAGLILTYPAFTICETIHAIVNNLDIMPETYDFGFVTLGKVFATDMWDYNVYEHIDKYDKNVLLLHGSKDSLVPVSSSVKAAEVYKNVDFYILEGAEHGFYDDYFNEALRYIFDYLKRINIIDD